ncbi:MAG: nucleotidyltransferase domain-containing protein [Candidatus Woesearchaeota archaeon]
MKQKHISLKSFEQKCKPFFEKHKNEIEDIVFFGSRMKGKLNPKDLDILLIFKKKVNKEIEYQLKNILGLLVFEINQISIISKTEESYKKETFDAREGVLFEGYSLIKSKFIASDFGFTSLGLFIYQTNKLSNVQKTKFYYALNGRGPTKGMVQELEGIKLSNNIIAVPLEKIEATKKFLNYWELEYKYVPTLIPKRLGKKSIIGKIY